MEGRVAIIVNGSPYVLAAPAVFRDFLTSAEDKNIQYQYTNLLKFIRFLALILTLTLPGFYIASTTFHQEIIPTQLLFAIVSSRSSVPFPIILELFIMDISLELIRESGIRVPSALGQTIGIVGGLILGDAAVSANLVSPILIIIIAITGLTSFAIPDYSFSFHIRLSRFIYVIFGYFAGFFGLAWVFFLHLGFLSSINSFGVSYLSPYAPAIKNPTKSFFINPIWKREYRDSFLQTKRDKSQSKISMKWKFSK
jgi:spore germination protein KA